MRVYLALGFRIGYGELRRVFDRVRYTIDNCLITYAYPQMVAAYVDGLAQGGDRPGRHLLLDSGAFTAWSIGAPVTREGYADWLYEVAPRLGRSVESLRYFNLDVLGDQAESWRNQAYLEARGLSPVPVVTFGAPLDDLRRALEYPLCALGGLVAHYREPERVRGWLDAAFGEVLAAADRQGRVPRVHVLGLTQRWIAERYPAYSLDSSSWGLTTRYGKAPAALRASGVGVPRVTASPAAGLINSFALRLAIGEADELARRCTALWAGRGVTFDDETC